MRRRDVLLGAGSLAAGAGAGVPSPAIAQGTRQLTMVTDWTDAMPGLLPSARRLAHTLGEATRGRIRIEVFPANAMVRAFETFDAVSAGVADMYHSYDGYFEKKSPALNFYCRRSLRVYRQRIVRLGPLRRRPGVVGRARRPVRHSSRSIA